jgi:hypothetical protein
LVTGKSSRHHTDLAVWVRYKDQVVWRQHRRLEYGALGDGAANEVSLKVGDALYDWIAFNLGSGEQLRLPEPPV